MKKVFTLCVAIMASAATFAQTTLLWDGEKYNEHDKGGFWDRCNQEIAVNPSKYGVNSSDKCLKFTISSMPMFHSSPTTTRLSPSSPLPTRVWSTQTMALAQHS